MSCEQKTYKLTREQVKAIEKMLDKGKRIELIPLKNGIKLMQIQRKDLKTE